MIPIVRYGYVLALLLGLNATSREEGDGRVAWWIFAMAILVVTNIIDSREYRRDPE